MIQLDAKWQFSVPQDEKDASIFKQSRNYLKQNMRNFGGTVPNQQSIFVNIDDSNFRALLALFVCFFLFR